MSAGRLAEVLAEHQRTDGYDTIGCTCGMRGPGASTWPNPVRARHHAAHLAAVALDLLGSDEVFEATNGAIVSTRDRAPLLPDDAPSAEVTEAALAAIRTYLTGDTQ